MARRLLLLLVVWPLLLPPGFCVCRVRAFAPPGAERNGAPPQCQAAAESGCRCCRPAAEPAAPSRVDLRPADSPEPHAPGCPASPCWEVARATISPARAEPGDFPSLSQGAAPLREDEAALLPTPAAPPPDPGPIAPSLFSCNFRC